MELMAEWQWKRWDAVARLGGEAHAAGGGACAPSFGPAGAPHSTGGRARGPGGAAAWQRRAGAGEQAPGGGAAPDPAAAADEVSRLQRRALHGEARRGAAPAPGRGADGAPRAARGRRAGRASALAIAAIYALSPQAKGRVERLWGTLQDRLVSELRLAGARTIAEANAVLERYCPVHNRRFAIPAQDTTPAWRPLRRGLDLDRVCSFRYEATVLNDNTIHLAGMVLDIPPGPRGRSYRDQRVEVRQLLDRSWRVYLGDEVIATGRATAHGELRAQRRRNHGRGAPSMAPLPPRLIEAAL